MQSFEIGILPESTCFFFSPSAQAQKLFFYPTLCGHFYCTDEYYIKRKTYPPLLLVYVCKGTFHIELESGIYDATAGQIAFFDCRQPHYYCAKDNLEFYYLHLDGSNCHDLCRYINKTSGIVIDGPNNGRILEVLMEIHQFYEEGGSESIFTSSNRVYQLLALLDNPQASPRLQKNDDSISRAIAYIRSNVGKKITLHELADLSGLSDYYFSHLFKEMTGQSPSEFIIYSRIDQAKALLISTTLSVAEIAHEVGYSNSSNLITLFTQRIGSSPAQFRKSHNPRGIAQ